MLKGNNMFKKSKKTFKQGQSYNRPPKRQPTPQGTQGERGYNPPPTVRPGKPVITPGPPPKKRK